MGALGLVFALLGGAFLTVKGSIEKGERDALNKSIEEYDRIDTKIRNTYIATRDHENLVRKYVLNENNFDRICTKYKKDFTFIFGDNYRELLRIPPNNYSLDMYKGEPFAFNNPRNHLYWVRALVLSTDGKLPASFMLNGLQVDTANRKMCYRFAQCIERNINEKTGGDIELVLTNTSSDNDVLLIKDICLDFYVREW